MFYPHPHIQGLLISKNGVVQYERTYRKTGRNKYSYPDCFTGKIYTDRYGYNYITLPLCLCEVNKTQNRKKYKIHRLLAQTFIPNPLNYTKVDHIDNNPLNNQLSNLRWCSTAQNNKWSNTGFNARSRYTSEQKIEAIKLFKEDKLSIQTISELTGIRLNTLYEARRQSTWKKEWKLFEQW